MLWSGSERQKRNKLPKPQRKSTEGACNMSDHYLGNYLEVEQDDGTVLYYCKSCDAVFTKASWNSKEMPPIDAHSALPGHSCHRRAHLEDIGFANLLHRYANIGPAERERAKELHKELAALVNAILEAGRLGCLEGLAEPPTPCAVPCTSTEHWHHNDVARREREYFAIQARGDRIQAEAQAERANNTTAKRGSIAEDDGL
jgi:hypothetical protein